MKRGKGGLPLVLLGTHSAALLVSIGWIFVDPLAVESFASVPSGLIQVDLGTLTSRLGTWRVVAIVAILALGALSILREAALWFRRSVSGTTIARTLAVTSVMAAWLALGVGLDSLEWYGKRLRSTERLNALELLAAELKDSWPKSSGEIEGLGPFTAYPIDAPRLLLLLTPHPLDASETVVSAIEQSTNGSLRFELGGPDGGEWIEWHPEGEPTGFLSGLYERRKLQRFDRLKGQWFLVSYSNADLPQQSSPSAPVTPDPAFPKIK